MKNPKAYVIAIAVIAIVSIAVVACYVGGVFTGTNNSAPLQTSSPTPSSSGTLAPTENPAVSPTVTASETPDASTSASASPTPTPTSTPLPSPSLTVAVTASNYNETMVQYTQFDCLVTINNVAYNSLLNRMVSSQTITVASVFTGNPVTGNLTTAILTSLPQLEMNYGFSTNVSMSAVQNDHFTMTFYSAKQTLLPGGINTSTLASALTEHLNQILATQV